MPNYLAGTLADVHIETMTFTHPKFQTMFQHVFVNSPIRHPSYFVTLAKAMMALGQADDAARIVDDVFRAGTQRWVLPELLRLRAATERAFGRDGDAETNLRKSLRAADEIGGLGWKLRSALDLALLLKDRGALVDARQILAPVYDQFTDGFDTGDLRNARRLLEQLCPSTENR